jgi:hypothetical protein
MNSRIFSILIAVLASLLVLACAKQVVLTGGAKDVTPPEPKASMPENGSTNFSTKHKSKYVVVKFNEYIKLNDVSSKLIVSPPMEEKPVAIVNGKKTENQDKDFAVKTEHNILPQFQRCDS